MKTLLNSLPDSKPNLPALVARFATFAALAFYAATAAQAEPDVRVCTNERGEKNYENSARAAKNCKRVELDAISVIPPATRQQRLPIGIGMSQDQVRNNWGKPAKVLRTQTRSGVTEQWTYAGGTLTFANGVLEMIQN